MLTFLKALGFVALTITAFLGNPLAALQVSSLLDDEDEDDCDY